MPLLRQSLVLAFASLGILSVSHAQDGYQCVDPKNMSVRYQAQPCTSPHMTRPAWRSAENPSGWTTNPPTSGSAQATASSARDGLTKNQSDLLNRGVSGAVGAAGVLLLLLLLGWVVRGVFRMGRSVAGKTAEIAAKATPEELAKAAGSVAGLAERRARKLRDAFNQGREVNNKKQ